MQRKAGINPVVEHFKDARSFVAALRWTDDRWYADPGRWVFRGHANADWRLTPRLWPEGVNASTNPYVRASQQVLTVFTKAGGMPKQIPPDQADRFLVAGAVLLAELAASLEFARLADELRFPLPIPLESLDLTPEIGDMAGTANDLLSWDLVKPPVPPDSRAALAQHHGVSTRLLDWTGNPLMAAFFAAWEGPSGIDLREHGDLAVWGLHPIAETFSQSRIQFLRFPQQSNAFLQAQRGLFTWDSMGEAEYVKTGKWPCQSEVLIAHPLFGSLPQAALRKLVLPRKEAPELLRLLRVEGISLAHLMPTLDNVARTVMRHEHWPFRRV